VNFLVHHLLRASAERYPRHEALVHGDQRVSYEQLWQRVGSLGSGLRDAGAARGDRVGVLLEPSLALATSLLGVSAADGVMTPIHHGLFAEQVEHIVRDCGMRGLITDAGRFARLQPMLESCDSLKFVVVVGETADALDAISLHDFNALCEASAEAPADAAIDRDLAAILYTSGSTGKPKGVMLTHANLVAGAAIVADYLHITHDDRTLAVLPFSFDAGLNQLMTALYTGATCVLIKFLFAKEIVAALAKERITGLAGVPSLWNLLAQDNSKLRETPLEHLRYITNTGGALPLNILAKLREALPKTDMVLMYGLTEAFRSTYLPPEELDRRPTSMGKAIPNTEIYVMNEAGGLCAPGEIGELVHRGPTVTLGYWGHPELTARVLRPNPFAPAEASTTDLVCYSGDLVKTDEDGFLYFVGRRDNQIKSAGFRISPNEVEAALCRFDGVREAAVIGLPDEVLGEHLKAFVVSQTGQVVNVDALLEEVALHLPRHMVPRDVEALDELPKTSSGKIDYPQLRRREGERGAP
jgi:acyl-CoA ligase (AMP-forming) (exosortase A-associated)